MSLERRLKRENNRKSQKNYREIYWLKIKKQAMTMLFVFTGFFVIILSFSWYEVSKQNSIRKAVALNSSTTSGKVTKIFKGRGHNYATYEFNDNEETFSGSTFSKYSGSIGDNICINYLKDNPTKNLCCDDSKMQDLFSDSFFSSFQMLGILIILIAIYLLWKIMINDKKILSEFTSIKT